MSLQDCFGESHPNRVVQMRQTWFRIINYIETCLTLAITCGMWAQIILIPTLSTQLYYSLMIACAITYSINFGLCAARSGSVRCRFIPIIICAIQLFAYLASGSLSISIPLLYPTANLGLYFVFTIYGFVMALWMIVSIVFPINTDKNCIQLCCQLYNKPMAQSMEPTVASVSNEATNSLKDLVAQTNQKPGIQYAVRPSPAQYVQQPRPVYQTGPFGSTPTMKYRYVGEQ